MANYWKQPGIPRKGWALITFQDKKTSKYKVKISDKFGEKAFDKIEKEKVAVFKGIEFLKEKGTW